jgi:hypothetical protein
METLRQASMIRQAWGEISLRGASRKEGPEGAENVGAGPGRPLGSAPTTASREACPDYRGGRRRTAEAGPGFKAGQATNRSNRPPGLQHKRSGALSTTARGVSRSLGAFTPCSVSDLKARNRSLEEIRRRLERVSDDRKAGACPGDDGMESDGHVIPESQAAWTPCAIDENLLDVRDCLEKMQIIRQNLAHVTETSSRASSTESVPGTQHRPAEQQTPPGPDSHRSPGGHAAPAAADAGPRGETESTESDAPVDDQIREKNLLIEILQKQVRSLGMEPVSEVVTLEKAKARLQEAMEKLQSGDDSAEKDLDQVSVVTGALQAECLSSPASGSGWRSSRTTRRPWRPRRRSSKTSWHRSRRSSRRPCA